MSGDEAEIVVNPDQFRIARLRRVRISVPCKRPRVATVLLREEGTGRWAAFRTLNRYRELTPILTRPGPKPRGQAYVVLDHPCVASHDPYAEAES